MRPNMKVTAPAPQARPCDASPVQDRPEGRPRLFLFPLRDDPMAHIKPWPAPMRIAFLGACTLLGWSAPVYLWLSR